MHMRGDFRDDHWPKSAPRARSAHLTGTNETLTSHHDARNFSVVFETTRTTIPVAPRSIPTGTV
jgi:hypothetical protein